MAVTWRVGLRATIVLATDESDVTVGTFVELGTRLGRLIWWALTPVHEYLLGLPFALAVRHLNPAGVAPWVLDPSEGAPDAHRRPARRPRRLRRHRR
jgi:hypothetical protein